METINIIRSMERSHMLVETKAKIGVFSIALGAYLPQFPSLVPEFEQQYEAFKKTIPDTVEIVEELLQQKSYLWQQVINSVRQM